MLKDNLISLRKLNGYSQGQIAEKIGITRQAYAKWENGSTVPDVDRASQLAKLYGISIDSLMDGSDNSASIIPPAPPGKNIWGTATMGERGQIVIPKAARHIVPSAIIVVLSQITCEAEIILAIIPAVEIHHGTIMNSISSLHRLADSRIPSVAICLT